MVYFMYIIPLFSFKCIVIICIWTILCSFTIDYILLCLFYSNDNSGKVTKIQCQRTVDWGRG